MADISDINSAQTVKVVGADGTGVEQTPVQSTANGGLHTNIRNSSGVEVLVATAALQTQPGVDIGDVTINNASGASAVNIQDGGNSLTVDGTIAATQSGIWSSETSGRAASQQVFSAQTLVTNIGTTETSFLLLKNPNASGKVLRILKIVVGTSGAGTIRVYHTPTITSNGAALAAVNRYIKSAPTAAVAAPFTAPNISVKGTPINLWYTTAQSGSKDFIADGDIAVDPNFNILITVQNGAANTPTAITVIWAEV